MATLLALDLGTTNVKAGVFDSSGRPISTVSVGLTIHRAALGRSEQDPEEIWLAAGRAVRQAVSESGRRVEALALSSQRNGLMLLSPEGRPLTPYITWMDRRQYDVSRHLLPARIPHERPGQAGRLLWHREHAPEVWAQTARAATSIKEWILWRLTGRFVVDVSMADVTGLTADDPYSWETSLCVEIGLSGGWLPEITSALTPVGAVSGPAAREWGVEPGLSVYCGCGDAEASSLGLGALGQGIVAVSIGTIGAVRGFIPGSTASGYKGGLLSVRFPELGQMTAAMVPTAGAVLEWARTTLHGGGPVPSFTDLAPHLEKVRRPTELLVIPHFNGANVPAPLPEARGTIFGLALHHTRADLLAAVMEGITHSLRQCLEALAVGGQEVEVVRSGGGGAKSSLWLQLQADVFGCPVQFTEVEDASLLGAAIIAAVGSGLYPDLRTAATAMVRVSGERQPDPTVRDAYAEQHRRFARLHGVLTPCYLHD